MMLVNILLCNSEHLKISVLSHFLLTSTFFSLFYTTTLVNKGIPAPWEQSPKLKIVLCFGLSRLKCTANAGLDNFQHVLLMHKKSAISKLILLTTLFSFSLVYDIKIVSFSSSNKYLANSWWASALRRENECRALSTTVSPIFDLQTSRKTLSLNISQFNE